MSDVIYIVCDFDGTLVDTQRFHARIESEFIRKYDITIAPEEITQKYAGRTPREWVAELLGEHNVAVDDSILEEFELHKNAEIVRLSKEGQILLLPGVEQFLQEAKNNPDNVKVGISSGTSTKNLEELIPFFKLDIAHYTSADEVVHKKPAPDVFNKTFERMGATIDSKKIVIGDGVSDIIGGKAAGAKTIYVNETLEKGKNAGADMSVHSFDDISIDIINKLF